MKSLNIILLDIIFVCLIFSCSTVEKTQTERKNNVSLHVGGNIGGITENTDMSVVQGVKVPDEATVDAFSGATNTGFNAGLRISHHLKRNQIETGLDYMFNFQKFNYIDVGNHYIGVREMYVSQLMIPLTYNISLFNKIFPRTEISFKLGLLGQLNLVSTNGTGILPEYSIIPFSTGPVFGFSFLPVHFRNGDKLGFYFDIYRGSQIYSDFYNLSEFEMPGSSFIKFGFKYQLH